MDFTNRTPQNQAHRADNTVRPDASQPVSGSTGSGSDKKKKKLPSDFNGSAWWKAGGIVFLFAVVILATALLIYIGFSNPSSQKYVNSDKYQAVFVNVNGTQGGQVYFGHIQNINNDYYRLTDVFFIQQNADKKASANNLVLQKLGCSQIHDPEDQMVINSSQVLWWENLNNDGQVVKQINNYDKQHPNGQDCSANQPANAPTANPTGQTQTPSNSTDQKSDNSSSDKNKSTNDTNKSDSKQ